MRSASVPALFFAALLTFPLFAQQSQPASTQVVVQRDPQAVAALQQSISAMGGNVPSDSTATGTVTITAGGATDQGTIRILTRGTQQTLEEVRTSTSARTVTFSNGEASEAVNGTVTPLPMQRVVTSQCPYVPLTYLAALLANPDEGFTSLGIEDVAGRSALHVRASNTYSSTAKVQFLSEFTMTDIWLDAQTELPLQVAYIRRDTGLSPRIRMEVQFSNYRSTSGFVYPATIQVLMNGTQWMTISLQTFQANLGLTDADFPVVEYRP